MATSSHPGIELVQALSREEVSQAHQLFLEYADSLGFSLCFQGFDDELKNLPGSYAPPDGCLLLARVQNHPAGCVALRPIDRQICEMKRLYVRPGHRGAGLGQMLIDRVITEAGAAGYERMRLDTIESSMQNAIALYRRKGFVEIAPYRSNPIAGALSLGLLP